MDARTHDGCKDRIWIPKTYQLYRNGACAIMGAKMKYYKKDIHYKDFLAFGEDQFIWCKNVLPKLCNMSSGNLSTLHMRVT